MPTEGLPDMGAAARRANAKLQRLENEAARREGREPRDLHAEMIARRRALRARHEKGQEIMNEYTYHLGAPATEIRPGDLVMLGSKAVNSVVAEHVETEQIAGRDFVVIYAGEAIVHMRADAKIDIRRRMED